MRGYCGVPQCKTYKSENVSMHTIPHVRKSKDLKRRWMIALRILEFSKYFLICSKHFTEKDFLIPVQRENVKRKVTLLPTAVPTLRLPKSNVPPKRLRQMKRSSPGVGCLDKKVTDSRARLTLSAVPSVSGKSSTITSETNGVNANDSISTKPIILSDVVIATGKSAETENLIMVDRNNEQTSKVIDKGGSAIKKPKHVCEVFDCNRDSIKYPTITFHSFPRDTFKRGIWIDFCWRDSDWQPKLNSKVCSVHFQTDDYEILKGITSLKYDACPSMYVESIEQETDDNMKQTDTTVKVKKNICEKEMIKTEMNSDISCSVSNCKNDYATDGDTVQFHKFPISPTRRKIWAKFCLRDDKWKPNSLSRICSAHFEGKDYLKTSLDPLKAKLKESACPSKYHNYSEPESKKRRIESEPLLIISSDEETEYQFDEASKDEILVENPDFIDDNDNKQDLIKENAELKATIAKLLECNKVLNANIESQLSYIETVENMCEEKNKKIKELEDILKDLEGNQKHNKLSHSMEIEMPDVHPSPQLINNDCKILKIATICRFCEKEFPSNTRLGKHMRKMHIKHLPFKCHLCVNCFASQAELSRHIKKHPGMKIFACSVCTNRFDEWSHLQEHLLEQHNQVAKFVNNVGNENESTKAGANFGVIFIEKKSRSSIVSGDEESEGDYVQKNANCNEFLDDEI